MAKTFKEVLDDLNELVFTSSYLGSVVNRIKLLEYINRWDDEIERLNQFELNRLKKDNLALSIELDKLDPIKI